MIRISFFSLHEFYDHESLRLAQRPALRDAHTVALLRGDAGWVVSHDLRVLACVSFVFLNELRELPSDRRGLRGEGAHHFSLKYLSADRQGPVERALCVCARACWLRHVYPYIANVWFGHLYHIFSFFFILSSGRAAITAPSTRTRLPD